MKVGMHGGDVDVGGRGLGVEGSGRGCSAAPCFSMTKATSKRGDGDCCSRLYVRKLD